MGAAFAPLTSYWSQLCLMYGSQLAPIAEIVMNASQTMAIHIVTRPRRRSFFGLIGTGSAGAPEVDLGDGHRGHPNALPARTRGSIHA